jgi:hypothetical protein
MSNGVNEMRCSSSFMKDDSYNVSKVGRRSLASDQDTLLRRQHLHVGYGDGPTPHVSHVIHVSTGLGKISKDEACDPCVYREGQDP